MYILTLNPINNKSAPLGGFFVDSTLQDFTLTIHDKRGNPAYHHFKGKIFSPSNLSVGAVGGSNQG
jgi:hypothetical protein